MTMRLADPGARIECAESTVYRELLPLDGARILDIGCGRAEHSREIARAFPRAEITAIEVDVAQAEANEASERPANLRFARGGAQALAAGDASFDIVLMFKSLHHVPGESLAHALAEVRRVLRPGGLAYISEPVFAGELNEVMRVFHDEEAVRRAAFEAIRAAVASGALELVEERFFLSPVQFSDFADFEARMIGVTHTHHRLSAAQHEETRRRFLAHAGPEGARFRTPMRVDLLRRPA